MATIRLEHDEQTYRVCLDKTVRTNRNDAVLTRHWRRDRVVVLRAQRVVHFDFFRKLLDGEPGQTAATELFRRRRVHLRVARSRQDLLADVQHAARDVQVVVRDQIAADFAGPPDALFERRTWVRTGITGSFLKIEFDRITDDQRGRK